MSLRSSRHRLLAAAALLALAAPLLAQTTPTATPPVTSWLHEGSDVPADPAWTTGTLANGLRYAVRRNATPPNTVAIRVRIDAGALMESDTQSGWAHFLEHMVFRGTGSRPDGEAVKLWQRLGARFGSDTNASTSLRATTYKLDIPRNDAASLNEAVGALADMMADATIDGKLVDIERKIVVAERAARITPTARRVQDAVRPLFLSGLLAETRDVGGSEASLADADAAGLRAFYERWYRPERAVVVIAGDAEPAALEALVKAKFGDWTPVGPRASEPDYGAPRDPTPRVRVVVDPLIPASAAVAWVAPNAARPATAERQRADNVEQIALRVLNQRLNAEVLTGGAILGAGVSRSRGRNLADQLTLSVSPRSGQWREALTQAFRVINRTLATPVDQAEIDQQVASTGEGLRRAIQTSNTWPSATFADVFVASVDGADVAGTRGFYADLFDAQKAAITPAVVQATLRTLFTPEPRLLLLTATPIADGDAAAAAALAAARAVDGGTATALRKVTLDELSPPRSAGTIAAERPIAEFGIDRIRFENGVELVMKRTEFARDSIGIQVRIGHGLSARAPGDPGLGWSGGIIPASGIADFTAPEIARFAAGRQVGYGISSGDDALTVATTTSKRDVADAMRVMLAGVTRPRFDEIALRAMRDGFNATYRSLRGQPSSVFGAFAPPALFSGDMRFRTLPPPREVSSTTIDAVRTYWTSELGRGPIRIVAVGDFDRAATIAAVARTFGALPARPDVPPSPASLTIPPLQVAKPLILTHDGDANQATVTLAWRTAGGLVDLKGTRALGIAAAIIQSRLIEEFRETEGGSYSPSVGASDLRGFEDFGQLVASAQLRPDRIADFVATLERIIADLAANGPSADALARARETAIGSAERARNGNGYWAGVLTRNLDDPRQLTSIRTYVSGRREIDAAAVQAVVKRYFAGVSPLRIEVLPRVPKPGTK